MGVATALSVLNQPSYAYNAQKILNQPVVGLIDASGAIDTSSVATVVATIASGTPSVTGTTSIQASGGIAQFTDLVLTGIGSGSFLFTTSGLTSALSNYVSVEQSSISIVPKRSEFAGRIPIASQLINGELAINITDKKGYVKNTSGDIVKVFTGVASSGDISSGQIGAYHFGASNLASGYYLRVDGTGILRWDTAGSSLTSGVVTSGYLGNNTVVSGSIASGSVSQFKLSSGTVTSGHVGNNAVVSGSIASGQIFTFHIGSGGIISGNIASGQVGGYHLAATGLASGEFLQSDGNGVLNWSSAAVAITNDTTTNATRYVSFLDATTGTASTIYTSNTKLTFNPSTGDFTAGGNITANSDARIKKNIKTIENAVDKVQKLRGVYFDRIGTDIKNIGVIAQEVEAVIPEVVRESDGIKSVAYGNIVALLIEAIKEQNQKIKMLEEKINIGGNNAD